MQNTISYRVLTALNAELMELVSFLAPWLAPIPSAYMVYRAGVTNFHLPELVALCMAGLIEGAGIMAIHTATRIEFYEINRRKSDPEPIDGKLGWAILAYIVLVLAVTILTDVLPGLERWSIVFVLPIVLLTYKINSVRMQQDRIERTVQERAQKRAAKRSKRRPTRVQSDAGGAGEGAREASTKSSVEHARRIREMNRTEAQRYRRRVILDTLQRTDGQLNITEVAGELDASRTTIYNDLDALESEGKISQDGERYIVLAPNGRRPEQVPAGEAG